MSDMKDDRIRDDIENLSKKVDFRIKKFFERKKAPSQIRAELEKKFPIGSDVPIQNHDLFEAIVKHPEPKL